MQTVNRSVSQNPLTQAIRLKRQVWSAAKSKSYSNSPRFKRALNHVYAQADWMVKQGYAPAFAPVGGV